MITPLNRLELLLWALLPIVITLLLLILMLTPKHVAGLGSFMPVLPMIPIFYWGMSHAREMPYWFVFFIGLIMDTTTGAPLGLSSLLCVVFLTMIHAQRKYIHKEGFIIKWGYFSVLLLFIAVLHWLMMSLLYGRLQPVEPALIQWFLTVCCYPLLHAGFDALAGHVHDRRRHLRR